MIEINKFICIGCGWCKDVCSTNAVQLAFAGEENYVCFNDIIVKNTCTNCGICINFCPVAAISPLTYKIPGTDVDVTNPDVTIPSVIDDGIWGGSGGTGLITDSPDYGDDSNYNTGITVLDLMQQKLNELCVYEVSNRGNAVLNSTSLALTAKGQGMLIIDAFKADAAFVRTIGSGFGYAGAGLNFLQFYIGVTSDQKVDEVDWVNLGAGITGALALYIAPIPVVDVLSIPLGIASIALGIYSAYLSECQ